MKFRKKPVVIEAVQWDGYIDKLPKWARAVCARLGGEIVDNDLR